MKQLLLVLFALAGALLTGCSRQAPPFLGELLRTQAWDPELVTEMASLPVQDNGRMKPLASFASFLLYKVHGRRDMKFTLPGEAAVQVKLEPTEWLLDVWCYPNQAAEYPLFRIENTGVLDALGIENAGQTLDFEYLSYHQLLAVNEKLADLAHEYDRIEGRNRNAVQEHVVQTWRQLRMYHGVHQQFAAMHHDFLVEGDELRIALGGKDRVRLGAFVEHAEPFRVLVRSVGQNLQSPQLGNATRLLETLDGLMQEAGGVALFPPPSGQDAWMGLGQPVDLAMRGVSKATDQRLFLALQSAIQSSGRTEDTAVRDRSFREFRQGIVAAAKVRGEYESIATESEYYRASWHYKSLHWFLTAFVLAAFCWMLPRSSRANQVLWWLSFGCSTIGLGMLTYDLYLRCIITGRPPIKNLYDTFLFIAAGSVLTLLVVEWIMRRRIALGLAPLAGGLLVMLARMFEVADGKDTLDPLVAVLDSNYWLATHVTMINTGYAAGLMAALLAMAWIFVRVTRIAHPSDPLSKGLIRAVYGVTCFSLLFSVVGTIWGGVWANDSWGRFWGWDPKENGALMICLMQIALLHARWSGLVRDFGIVIWASVIGMIVMFSWFHTNLLGVGLHNYGFSSGLRNGVWIGYSVHLSFMLVGAVDVWLRPKPVRAAAGAAPVAAAE